MPSWAQHPVIKLLADGFREIVRAAFRELVGDAPEKLAHLSRDDIENIVEASLEAAFQRFAAEFQAQINAIALRQGLSELADGAKAVLDAFVVKGEIPPLGLSIEIVKDEPLPAEGDAKPDPT